MLLHEAVHVYTFQLGCTGYFCQDNNNVCCGGHGRAFQRLAYAVETAAMELLGLKLRLGGSMIFMIDWNDGRIRLLPSKHDIEDWGW